VQTLKQYRPIVAIDEGIQIDGSDEQSAKADSPMTETLQPDSHVKFKRALQ
jgi:hypothetical protein